MAAPAVKAVTSLRGGGAARDIPAALVRGARQPGPAGASGLCGGRLLCGGAALRRRRLRGRAARARAATRTHPHDRSTY